MALDGKKKEWRSHCIIPGVILRIEFKKFKNSKTKLALILGFNLYFLGTQFCPNSIEACFRAATEMAPIGSKNGAVWRAYLWCHICEQFGFIITSAARTKRKKRDKLKLGRMSCFEGWKWALTWRY